MTGPRARVALRERAELAEGLRLLAEHEARAAHESFEDVWRAHTGTQLGEVARALSQWAAACVHRENGRDAGFQSLAQKCARRLAEAEVASEFQTAALAAWMARAAAASEPVDPCDLPLD